MPDQLQLNIEFLLLRAGQLANIFTTTITDLNANVACNMAIYRLQLVTAKTH